MTELERELLLNDLSARVAYRVKFEYNGEYGQEDGPQTLYEVNRINVNGMYEIEGVKPYLRSMSSMTDDEKEVYKSIAVAFGDSRDIMIPSHVAVDFLIKNHFDWRDLIKIGLAHEAPQNMY